MNRSIRKQLKIRFGKNGYKRVTLRTINGGKKTCNIHIIKAKAFLFGPNPLGADQVRHLNDIKVDNRLENLMWGTQSDNVKDCVRNGKFNYEAAAKNFTKGRAIGDTIIAKKYSKPVKCLETGIIYTSTKEASRQTGIFSSSISHCCNGKRQTAGGFHFEYVDQRGYLNEW